ncbi:MAG: DUF4832 domain-containing protein [Lentisphaeria bacterium]|nr:MAG: DUF4832 domain-containing protein [Lentisphaeria bacterium]
MVEPGAGGGKFTWNVVDAPAQRWIARGKKIALRFVTSGTGELEYATPKWVFDAGAKKIIVRKNGIDSREVIQDDPVFLAKLENFLRAAAKRYNGNPDVAFLDVAFGTWGEGHTLNSLKLSPEENARQARIHALLYRKHFPDTLLAISDDVIGPTTPGKDFPLMKELRELGITLRDDSVLCTRPATYHGELAQNYWPTMPVVLEHEHLAEAATKKMTWSNFLLLKTIEKYHASYLSIHDWPDSEKRILGPYLDRINRRLGYRIRPVRIDYPAEIEPGKPFSFRTVIGNAGVAPCYPGGFPAFTLKDKKGESPPFSPTKRMTSGVSPSAGKTGCRKPSGNRSSGCRNAESSFPPGSTRSTSPSAAGSALRFWRCRWQIPMGTNAIMSERFP